MSESATSTPQRPYFKALNPRCENNGTIFQTSSGPKLIAVASGKGGVGKTWFTLTLAHALLRDTPRHRILIVDGDFGLGNVDIQLGLHHRLDITHFLKNQASLKDVITPCLLPDSTAAEGHRKVDVLPGQSGTATLNLLQPQRLDDLLRLLRGMTEYDLVLIDLCAGIDWSSRVVAACADMLLLVTTEEPTALTDAYAVLKLSMKDRQADGKLSTNAHVVVNQASNLRAGQAIYGVLSEACGRFLRQKPALAGIVRRDRRVSESIRRQSPFLEQASGSVAALDISRIARYLLDEIDNPEIATSVEKHVAP